MAVVKYKSKDGSYKTLYNYNINNVPVVQGTGTSTDSVMSQKAVTDELAKYVEKPTTGTEYATQKWVTDQAYLQENALTDYATKSEVNAKADSATTLAGYGITDAKIEGGTITLGNQSLTPLASTALNGYATESWVNGELAKKAGTGVASSGANGLMSSTDKGNLDFLFGVNTVTTLANIPVDKRLVVASISSGSLTLASTPGAGREIHVIIKNTSSSDITVTIPNSGSYNSAIGTSLKIKGNSYGEVNIISDGTTMYVRGV